MRRKSHHGAAEHESRLSAVEVFSVLHRRMEWVGEVLAFVGMMLISVSILVLISDIVGRKTIDFTVYGIDDVNGLLIMSFICLALPFAFLREGHVGVEFITDALPRRTLVLVKLAVAVIICGWVGVLVYFSYLQAVAQIAMGSSSPTLAIPIVWYWTPLLIGMAVSVVACLVNVFRDILEAFSGHDPLGAGHRSKAGSD